MSSAGQPENNDLSQDHDRASRARHSAAGGTRRRLLRAARRIRRLQLSRSQRHVLAAIRDELQAEAELAALFSLFTSATSGAAMPKTERVPAWGGLAGWGRRLAFLNRRIVLAVAIMVPFAAVVALALALSSPGGHQVRCGPSHALDTACPGSYQVPAGIDWQQLQGFSLQPTSAVGHR